MDSADSKITQVLARDSVTLSARQSDASSNSSASLFSYELVQLTDSILANYSDQGLNTTLLEFGSDSEDDLAKRSLFTTSGSCKTAVGDWLWPSELVWDLIDILLGGALIKTTPLAAVCYEDFDNYDAEECAFLTANWLNDSYVP